MVQNLAGLDAVKWRSIFAPAVNGTPVIQTSQLLYGLRYPGSTNNLSKINCVRIEQFHAYRPLGSFARLCQEDMHCAALARRRSTLHRELPSLYSPSASPSPFSYDLRVVTSSASQICLPFSWGACIMKGFRTKAKNSNAFHCRRCKRENTWMILSFFSYFGYVWRASSLSSVKLFHSHLDEYKRVG